MPSIDMINTWYKPLVITFLVTISALLIMILFCIFEFKDLQVKNIEESKKIAQFIYELEVEPCPVID